MQVLKVNQENLNIAIDVLLKDGTVVFPTETAYGLAGDPFNKEAINKIYKIKGRNFNKPLPLIAENFDIVKKYFYLNKIEKNLAEKHWPGALTIILKLKGSTNRLQAKLGANNRIAVRISSDDLARNLASSLRGFVISTSANISGESECYSASAVVKQFKNKKNKPACQRLTPQAMAGRPDLILDAGELKKQKPSTIILVKGKKINILRQGDVAVITP